MFFVVADWIFFYIFAEILKRKDMTIDEAFVKYTEIFEFSGIDKKLEEIVDIEELKRTPVSVFVDSGLAFDGALIYHTIMTWHFANKLLKIYNVISGIDIKSLAKVIILHQIGKVGMFKPNENEWEVKKLNKFYEFVDIGVSLKTSDRSKMLCSNCGISFNLEEYEAMSVLDKNNEEYESSSKYRTHLSTIVKMSNDLAYSIARERYKKSLINNSNKKE